jgi:cobalt-zinc-cadmium efflux system outer membrane protein
MTSVFCWGGRALGLSLIAALAASAEPPPPLPLASGLPAYAAPADPEAAPDVPPEPVGSIVLGDALAAALARSPALAAFSWEVRAREAALVQAHARPNPELRAEIEDFAGSGPVSGFDAAQTTLSVSQLLELGGKRGRRVERAGLERDLAGWDYEAARLAVATSTAEAFFRVLALQRRLAIAEDGRGVAGDAVRAVEAAVRAGGVSPVEAARARVARERAGLEHAALARELAAARTALATHWGASDARFERAIGDLDALALPPPLTALLPLAEESPGLARFASELAARRAALAAEQAERTPDVRLALGGRHYADGGDGGVVAELSLPLPLFDQRRGALLEARYRLRRAESERRAADVAIGAALRSAHQRLTGAFEEALALRERATPEAERAFEGAREAWRHGLLRYVEVLDTQRTLFALRAEEVDALASYHAARTELEGLIGRSLAHAASSSEVRP